MDFDSSVEEDAAFCDDRINLDTEKDVSFICYAALDIGVATCCVSRDDGLQDDREGGGNSVGKKDIEKHGPESLLSFADTQCLQNACYSFVHTALPNITNNILNLFFCDICSFD